MRIYGPNKLFVLTFIILVLARPVWAYQVTCDGVTFSPSGLTSVFGEARPPVEGTPTRFHRGVDIANNCAGGKYVRPIEGGTVRDCVGVGVNICRRIESPSGKIFQYVHINPLVSPGASVTTLSNIGTIDPDERHLHLEEVSGSDLLNPLRSGALAHTDSDSPAVDGNTGLAETIESISAIRENTNPDIEDGNAFNSINSRFPLVNGLRVLSGQVDILVSGRDGGDRKGIYRVLTNARSNGNDLYNPAYQNIQFDRISTEQESSHIMTLYLYRNLHSDVMFATNRLNPETNNVSAGENVWDTTHNFDGPVEIFVGLDDIDGHWTNAVINAIIDNYSPQIFFPSPLNGEVVYNLRPTVIVQYADTGSGVDLNTAVMYLNGSIVQATANQLGISYTPASDLSYGNYQVRVEVKDRVGQSAVYSWAFEVSNLSSLDTIPPPAPVVYSGTHPDPNQSYINNSPQFGWDTPSDPSGIAGFSWTLDQIALTVPDAVSDGLVNQVSFSNVSAGTWYFHIRTRDGAGNWSETAHFGINIASPPDATQPTMPIVIDDGIAADNPTQLHASWSSQDPESGIAEYLYAIGTTAGGEDVIPFTSAGGNTGITRTGLNLIEVL